MSKLTLLFMALIVIGIDLIILGTLYLGRLLQMGL